MRKWSLLIVFKAALVACVLCVQGASLAHASVHGDDPHEHEGVECEIQTYAAEDQTILPAPPPIVRFVVQPRIYLESSPLEPLYLKPLARGPPVRGPPALIQ